MDSGTPKALADGLLLWDFSILFVEKKEGKESGQANRETGGKTACDSWDPAHPARDSKVETRADGADYAGRGTGRLLFLSGWKREKLPDRWRKQFGRCSRKIPAGTIFKIPNFWNGKSME